MFEGRVFLASATVRTPMRNLQPHCSSGWRECFRLSVLRVLLVLLPGREEEEEEDEEEGGNDPERF